MTQSIHELERQYRSALRGYLEGPNEQALGMAYDIGRKAIGSGLGVLELASIHQKVVTGLLADLPLSRRAAKTVEASLTFFHESLSPFEMTLRGFRENNERLHLSLQQLTEAQQELQLQNEALTVARQRYREQFNFAPDGYLVTDLNGVIEEANVAAAVLLHMEQEALVGNSLTKFLEADDHDAVSSQLVQLQSGALERVRDWQNTIRPKSGRPFPAALTVGVIRDNAGHPAGLRWLVRDITHFKDAEAERSELLIREKVARAEAEAARRMAFLAEASTLLTASLESETTLRNVANLAVPFLADWCFFYIVDDDGTPRRVARAHSDPSKAELARSLDGCDLPKVPEWVERALQSARSEIVANISPDLLQSVASNEMHFRILTEMNARCAIVVPLVARGRTLGAIVLLSAESGRQFGSADQALAEDLARRCAFAVDNSRLYSEVIVQRDKAEKASRVKDEFLAILSHELRNPLVPILGWARILKGRISVDDDVLSEGIQSLERNAQNIQRLVDDCLEMVKASSRSIRLALERIDLNQIATASIEAIIPLARDKGLKLDVDLIHTPVWVVGDRTRLEQVVMNLLTNAVKYTPSGRIQIRSSRTSTEAIITVKDTGIGIAPDFIPKVFEPFRQITSAWLTSDSGLGIGLSIAREIVQLHTGRIWAESDGLRRGSTFSVALPLSTSLEGSGGAGRPDLIVRAPAARQLRLLLVEDSNDVLFLIQKELEWAGYLVSTATNGGRAIEVAKEVHPDLIISDIKMPEVDGYQFIQQVKKIPELESVPAIAMTGFGMASDVEMALAAGYNAHLVKPIDLDQLCRLIEEITAQPSTFSKSAD